MRPLNFKSIHNAEVFYCIRQEDRKGEPFSSYAWQTSCDQLTSDHARRCVQRLLKNDTLKTALDPLLDIPALRQGLMISTIHKLIEAKVPEEAKAYLDHTYSMWIKIVGNAKAALKLDPSDVQALELRCPRFCTRDAEFIKEKIEQRTILKAFDEIERERILEELLELDTTITSLHTFSQDIHVLEACAASMRHLVSPGKQTIRKTLMESFRGPSQRQHSEHHSAFGAALEELWTFMLQNFQDMPCPSAGTTERMLAGPLLEHSQQETVTRSAQLAMQLGFFTPEVQRYTSMGAAGRGERDAAKPKDFQHLKLPTTVHGSATSTYLAVKQSVEQLGRRCGRPKKSSFQIDRLLLTKENLQADFKSFCVRGPELSSFFILRCQHQAFFRSTHSQPSSPTLSVGAISVEQIESLMDNENTIAPTLEQSTKTSPPEPPPVGGEDIMPLGDAIQRWRAQSESSSYTGESFSTQPTDVPTVAPAKQEEGPSTDVQISFREFRDGQFHTIEQVDAEEAETTAQRLLSDKLLLSHTLAFIRTHECVQAAQASGINSIIVLPREKWSRDEKLAKAVRQLKMDIVERAN